MLAVTDPDEQKVLRKMCAEDLLFYLHSFVWIFQAKDDPKPVPFNLYDFQIECMTLMWKCMHDGQEDLRLKKPRDMGATWMVLCLFEHAWHFMPNIHLLLGSHRENEVDGTAGDASGATPVGEWSKLLPKIDFIHLHQPRWLLPNGYTPRQEPFRTRMKIANPELGSIFAGESASPKFGRSARYYAIGFDEHAHTDQAYQIIGSCSSTSDCHLWWSSPAGPSTAFAMLGRSDIKQIELDWWMHPLHAKGMTYNPALGDRGRSSPWFVKRMKGIGNDPTLANNEIWADETQSSGGYYHRELFDMMLGVGDKKGTVRNPSYRGELDFQVGENGPWPTRWIDQQNGRWQLWLHLDEEGRPPRDERYILGIDVAQGSVDAQGRGATNSTIEVIGQFSRQKVAEYAGHGMPAHRFAQLVLASARWFAGTERHGYMIWDAGGPGDVLGSIIVDDNGITENVYFRISKTDKMPGHIKGGRSETAAQPWGQHVKMLWEGSYIEVSRDTVEEMQHYNSNPAGGAPVHGASKMTDDPSGARENHGDRTTGTVLACIELKKRLDEGPTRKEDAPPFGSILHMRQLDRRRRLEAVRI